MGGTHLAVGVGRY